MPLFDSSGGTELHEREGQVHGFARGVQLKLVARYELVEADDQAPRRFATAGAGAERVPEQSLQVWRARHREAEEQARVAQGPAPAATIEGVDVDGGHDLLPSLAPGLRQRPLPRILSAEAAHDQPNVLGRNSMAGGHTTQSFCLFSVVWQKVAWPQSTEMGVQ